MQSAVRFCTSRLAWPAPLCSAARWKLSPATLPSAHVSCCSVLPCVRDLATIAVGMSGGVDSSVTALLLKRQGHSVTGIHMRNWDSDDEGYAECREREFNDARQVCSHLGIGFKEVNFVREYWQHVFHPFIEGLSAGGTPNPDVHCNRHIKFKLFLEHALSEGAEFVATGHYARLRRSPNGKLQLLRAVDHTKDQSFFLIGTEQRALQRTLFPLGELRKDAVRALAAEAGLHTATKRDSTGICFVGKRRFTDFIKDYLPPQPRGPMVCIDTGRVLGEHEGLSLYTTGQRARIGGLSHTRYVVSKDLASNTIFVCDSRTHDALAFRQAVVAPAHWIADEPPETLRDSGTLRCSARFMHLGADRPASLSWAQQDACGGVGDARQQEVQAQQQPQLQPQPEEREQQVLVTLDECAQMTPMQAVAFYDGDVCLGGGQIARRGESLFDCKRQSHRHGALHFPELNAMSGH